MEATKAVCPTNLALTILFVSNPENSADFYAELLGMEPVERSPTFAMFSFPSGAGLGLWSSATTAPAVTGSPGASEICFLEEAVDDLHATWSARGVPIAQPPTEMDFGRTFVATDPDGHRIRVFWPNEG